MCVWQGKKELIWMLQQFAVLLWWNARLGKFLVLSLSDRESRHLLHVLQHTLVAFSRRVWWSGVDRAGDQAFSLSVISGYGRYFTIDSRKWMCYFFFDALLLLWKTEKPIVLDRAYFQRTLALLTWWILPWFCSCIYISSVLNSSLDFL